MKVLNILDQCFKGVVCVVLCRRDTLCRPGGVQGL
jgi:hypothetical protein